MTDPNATAPAATALTAKVDPAKKPKAPPKGNAPKAEPAAGATSDGGPEAEARAALLKAVAEIGDGNHAAFIPAGMDVEIRLVTRAATTTSRIEHDGEGYGPGESILLTHAAFEALQPSGALAEDSWDDCAEV